MGRECSVLVFLSFSEEVAPACLVYRSQVILPYEFMKKFHEPTFCETTIMALNVPILYLCLFPSLNGPCLSSELPE